MKKLYNILCMVFLAAMLSCYAPGSSGETPEEEDSDCVGIVALSDPDISLPEGIYDTEQQVEITSEDNAIIRYTTSGNNPDLTSSRYTGPITIRHNTIVKAIACKCDLISNIAEAAYNIKLAMPYFDIQPDIFIGEQTVRIEKPAGLTGYSIYYTLNGDDPTTSSDYFTASSKSFTIDKTTTIKAMVVKDDFDPSDILAGTFTIQNKQPVIRVYDTANSTKDAIISTFTEGATIYYTVDGSEPAQDSYIYNGGVLTLSAGTTIKAITVKPDTLDSEVVTIVFGQKVDTPHISPADGIYSFGNQIVTVTPVTDGSIIYYRLDEYFIQSYERHYSISDPVLYLDPLALAIDGTTEFRITAIATKNGMIDSDSNRVYITGSQAPESEYPRIESLTPSKWSSSIDEYVNFTVTVSDPDGHEDINRCRMSIRFNGHGTTNPTTDVILFDYFADYSDVFRLFDGSSFIDNCEFGDNSVIEINNASIDLANCQVVRDGETISLTFSIKPKSYFVSDVTLNPKRIWCWIQDKHKNASDDFDHNLVWEIGSWLIKN